MYQVLGNISFENEEEIHLPPRLQAFLALLLVSPGLAVDHEAVARCFHWSLPIDMRSFRKLVSDLRDKELPGIGMPRNTGSQCKIEVDRLLVDYLRFEDALKAAREQISEGFVAMAHRALSEWSGDPLQGLRKYDFDQQRHRLRGIWRRAWLDVAQGEFELGNSVQALEEASSALLKWPGDETFSTLRAEAQRALQEGTDTAGGRSASIRGASCLPALPPRLGQPGQGSPVGGRRRTGGPRTNLTPWQVPAGRTRLIGRDRQFEEIGRMLDSGGETDSRVVILSGMPGVGKTQLAIAWAHTRREVYEGALYVNLRGVTAGGVEPAESVLARFLADLDVKPSAETPEAMAAAYRSALAARPVLVILDNVRNAEQARPLLPGPGASAAIVTSQDRLDGLAVREGARRLLVEPLSHSDCLVLLKSELGEKRVSVEWMYADDLVRYCAGLPLAVNVLAANAASRPKQPLRELAKQLSEERTRLNSLGHADLDIDVRTVFGHSYVCLSPGARSLLHRVAFYPGPTINLHAVGSLSALDGDSTLRAIEELRTASLLDEPEHERFSIHDLVRVFAVEMAGEHEADRVGEILDDVFNYLLHSAYACDREIVRGRVLPIDHDAARIAFRPNSSGEALAWFDAEYPALLTAIRRAEAEGRGRFAWLLPMVVVTYQWRRRLYGDSRESLGVALLAVEQVGSLADQAAVYRLLAGTLRNLGDFSMAFVRLKRALRLSGEARDTLGSALAASNLGVVCRESGEAEEAVDHFTRALGEFRSLGDVLGESSALAGLGAVHFDERRYDRALQLCTEALGLFEVLDEQSGVGDTRRMLGRIRAAQGDDAHAIKEFTAARECYQRMGYPPREAEVLREASDLLARTGRIAEARSALQDAREIYAGLVEPQADLNDIEDRMRRLESSPVTPAGGCDRCVR